MPTFRITEGSLQERYHASRAPIQIFAGGFGNGKTANTVVKGLQLVKDYPGCNALIARSTLPKLNDTIRKEFLKWCPSGWIKQFNMPSEKSSTCYFVNGSVINFRYMAQQGKSNEASTSNLLSATYDFAAIDQIEDPENTHKDFLDILGRLRGRARYIGTDETMPREGPGWLLLTTNPTRNWVYRKLVKPLHDYNKRGQYSEDLLVDNNGQILIELFEGSTYENRENLPEAFLQKLEAAYHGQMRTRYLMGEWGGFEGLVYPQWDDGLSCVAEEQIITHKNAFVNKYKVTWIEGFDFGIASPSCYLLAYVDNFGNVIIVDGFYLPLLSADDIIENVKNIRRQWIGSTNAEDAILGDPSIFKRTGSAQRTVGPSTADLLHKNGTGLRVIRGNNDVINGVIKAQSYLTAISGHKSPFTRDEPAPYLYVNSKLSWFQDEISDYYWDKDKSGEPVDKPKDIKDHAMDALRYLLTKRPVVSSAIPTSSAHVLATMRWHERDIKSDNKKARYG